MEINYLPESPPNNYFIGEVMGVFVSDSTDYEVIENCGEMIVEKYIE